MRYRSQNIKTQVQRKSHFVAFTLFTIAVTFTVSEKSRRWKKPLLSVIDGVSPLDVSDEKLVRF
jgi:hypothetical protein